MINSVTISIEDYLRLVQAEKRLNEVIEYIKEGSSYDGKKCKYGFSTTALEILLKKSGDKELEEESE